MRRQIENAWDALVLDHAGATEIGPWGFGSLDGPGLHVNEAEFIAECIDPETSSPVEDNQVGELILTSLGRAGHPIFRYRTGDLVRCNRQTNNKKLQFTYLADGILGRVDQMLIIRGVNILPSAVEQIIRGATDVGEFRLTASHNGAMDELKVEVEADPPVAADLGEQLQTKLGLRIAVVPVDAHSLPRFEGKAKRFVDLRTRGA